MALLIDFPATHPSSMMARFGTKIAPWRERIRSACGAFEWVTLSYLTTLNVVIMVFFRSIPHPQSYIAAHQCVALGILLVVGCGYQRPLGLWRFVRHWYPLPLYVGLFEELRGLVHLVFPGWFDAGLLRFDFWLCGAQPAVWMSQFARPALNDFMQFSYMTYFLYLVLLPGLLYVRRETRAFWTVMTSTALAHYTVYLIAVVFPIESPHFSLARASAPLAPLTGGFSTALIGAIETYGRVRGAAFPSAHVAGSMVAILCAWRYRRWLFWATLPFFLSMMVATVYGRYHYVADVLAGMLVGTAGYAAGLKLMRNVGAMPVEVCAATAEGSVDHCRNEGRCDESCRLKNFQHPQSDSSPHIQNVVALNCNH
jgi:membrane-associated phospholipid phosphatase